VKGRECPLARLVGTKGFVFIETPPSIWKAGHLGSYGVHINERSRRINHHPRNLCYPHEHNHREPTPLGWLSFGSKPHMNKKEFGRSAVR